MKALDNLSGQGCNSENDWPVIWGVTTESWHKVILLDSDGRGRRDSDKLQD